MHNHDIDPSVDLESLGDAALCCLTQGQTARVTHVGGPNRCRLMEMGLTNGAMVEVVRRAAFGGPIEVRLRSYRLSLRREEAEAVRVEHVS